VELDEGIQLQRPDPVPESRIDESGRERRRFGGGRVLHHPVVPGAGAVAAVERAVQRLVGLVHRSGHAHAKVLVQLAVDAKLADERRATLSRRQHGAANLAASDRTHRDQATGLEVDLAADFCGPWG
jgi:hypothetical protein